jgi:GNAT superfamily N-acetyltransferase
MVLRPHDTFEELAGHEPPGTFAAAVREGGELVAVGMISPDGTPGGWRIRGMATVAAHRGRGVGGAVLTELIGHARGAGATRIWCNARVPAISLYERAGLRVASGVFEIEPIGPHVVMEWRARTLGDPPSAATSAAEATPMDATPPTASAPWRAARRRG